MKLIKKDNKGFLVLCIVMIILVGLDIYSTFSAKELAPVLESNPLFKFIGFPGLIILNLVWFVAIYLQYNRKKSKPFGRYVILLILLFAILLRITVVHGNFQVIDRIPSIEDEPIKYEEYKQIVENRTYEQKVNGYKEFVFKQGVIILIPILLALITYLMFSLDHTIKRKE